MRQLKFRAWDNHFKKFVEDTYLLTGDYKGIMEIIGVSNSNEEYYEDAEIQQFTGLKDKNGKEIYEGDIVTDGTVFEIVWRKGGFDFRYISGARQVPYFGDNCSRMEIIGNKYEHPHLLAPQP